MDNIHINEKSKCLKGIIGDDTKSNLLQLHKEAIKVERERCVKYILSHFKKIHILDEEEFERYYNIFIHDLDS